MSHIPSHAKKMFSGVIFDTYQWEQIMFDGSTATFEMLKRMSTVSILATTKEHTILLAHQQQPHHDDFISLPGGKQDPGETPLETAKRELQEESGYTSNEWELYKSYKPYNKIDWEVFVYIAKNCKKTHPQQLDPGEKISISTVSFEEFIETVTVTSNFHGHEIVEDILRMQLGHKDIAHFKKQLF